MSVNKPVFTYPINITGSVSIEFRYNSFLFQTVSGTLDSNADYFVQGDLSSGSSGVDFLHFVSGVLNTNTAGIAFELTMSDNKVQILSDASTSIQWNSAATTSELSGILGFDSVPLPADANTQSADYDAGNQFLPRYAPSKDNYGNPIAVGAIGRSVDGTIRRYDLTSPKKERKLQFPPLIFREDVYNRFSSLSRTSLETFWTDALRQGARIRYAENRDNRASFSTYRSIAPGLPWADAGRAQGQPIYAVQFELIEAD